MKFTGNINELRKQVAIKGLTGLIFSDHKAFSYDDKTNIITLDGSMVDFKTEYIIFNLKKSTMVSFKFDHSTGSEWDADTIWVYKSDETDVIMNVTNDSQVVCNRRADMYKSSKRR